MNEAMLRLINLRVLMAQLRDGLVNEKSLALAKDHYGLPPEATEADLLESVKDDANAAAEALLESAG